MTRYPTRPKICVSRTKHLPTKRPSQVLQEMCSLQRGGKSTRRDPTCMETSASASENNWQNGSNLCRFLFGCECRRPRESAEQQWEDQRVPHTFDKISLPEVSAMKQLLVVTQIGRVRTRALILIYGKRQKSQISRGHFLLLPGNNKGKRL